MGEGIFKPEDLIPCEWQHQIRHRSVDDFLLFEKVFLKSNPEFPIFVYLLDDESNKVICIWVDKEMGVTTESFSPECLLQYRFAGLMKYRRKFNICLN